MNILGGSQNTRVGQLNAYEVRGDLYIQAGWGVCPEDKSLFEILNPIEDASHTRDRKTSPPDSACTRGTRLEVVKNITTWAQGDVVAPDEPHIRWMHGYVGSGKSAISQEVCDKSEGQGRPVASFFFYRNSGDRCKIWRLAATLASQMAAMIPETESFIRSAAKASPGLVKGGQGGVSIGARMRRLIYGPLKAAVQMEGKIEALTQGPFLIVLDGLDECDNKDEVQELIDGMILFFDENPFIPLRVFITSRVEQHIQSRLNVPGVQLDNLVDHCSDHDVATFLRILFEDGCMRNPVIRAYVRQHGEWPTSSDRNKLVQHIGGSFIFASALFKFIMTSIPQGDSPTTPMERLPLALKMNPDLDGLYAQTLARSEKLPHFLDIISTIALLRAPLPTSGIAELLGINTYEVVDVLADLQAIIQVPGTDDLPVTLCHTSLRDFLTTQNRSGKFFAHPRHHVRIFLRCLECELRLSRRNPGVFIQPSELTPTVAYGLRYSIVHLRQGCSFFERSECDAAVQLRREGLALHPKNPGRAHKLADALHIRALRTGSQVDRNEAISLFRDTLQLRQSPHPDRPQSLDSLGVILLDCYQLEKGMADLEEAISLLRESLELLSPHSVRSCQWSLNNLGNGLLNRYRSTGCAADLEESISLLRESLELRPWPHPDRSISLNNLGNALLDYYRHTKNATELKEAISLYREALGLRPWPHPDRSPVLNSLGCALLDDFRRTGDMADLEEAISLYREALENLSSPHPHRSVALINLVTSFQILYKETGALSDLQEAIDHCEELLAIHHSPCQRVLLLNRLLALLQTLFDATGQQGNLARIEKVKEEANRFSASASAT